MAGLLSGDYMPDPLAQGLLGASAALLTPRAMGGGIGPGMAAFAQQAQQAQMMRRQMAQDAMRQRLMDAQYAETMAQADERKARLQTQNDLQSAAAGAYTPAVPDTWEGPGSPASFDQKRFIERVARVAPLEAIKLFKEQKADNPLGKIDPKDYTPESFAAFMKTGDATALRRYIAPDKPDAPTEIQKLIDARNALPPNSPDRRVIDQRIDALNYRQPPANMNVSYGAPFTGVDPTTGQPMLYQPSNRGGPPTPTGLAPPPQPGKDLPEGAAKQVAGTRNLRDAIGAYQAELKNWDRFAVVSPAKVAKMDTLYNNMMLQAKEAYNLGVLNGPDYEIMTRVVTPPASLKGMMYGSQALSDQATTLSKIAGGIEQQVVAAHPGRSPGAAANGGAAPASFPMLPNAKDYDGKVARDQQTGKRYKSVGGKWEPMP